MYQLQSFEPVARFNFLVQSQASAKLIGCLLQCHFSCTNMKVASVFLTLAMKVNMHNSQNVQRFL